MSSDGRGRWASKARRLSTLACFMLVITFPCATSVDAHSFSYATAGTLLLRHVYNSTDTAFTFYCGCSFNWTTKDIDLGNCADGAYHGEDRSHSSRAARIEYEHLFPASELHHRHPTVADCWGGHEECVRSTGSTYTGRECCRKVDPLFKAMESDLHNLVPSVGQVNAKRSNYAMGELAGEHWEYEGCDVEFGPILINGTEENVVEPRGRMRGDVARAWMYMSSRYSLPLSPREDALFALWSAKDPVDDWDCLIDYRIGIVQGNYNPLVRLRCSGTRALSEEELAALQPTLPTADADPPFGSARANSHSVAVSVALGALYFAWF